MEMEIVIIAAVAENSVIGNENSIPWKLPTDMARFRDITMGHAVLMGRNTYKSIQPESRPLPGRDNIIITRDLDYRPDPYVLVVNDFNQAVQVATPSGKLFVAGGAEVYKLALPHATSIVLTKVHARVEGNVIMPPINWPEWTLVFDDEGIKNPKDEYEMSFLYYVRAVP
ncbi:MAG: dihydrofolate reductase [Candidatus Vogelbacteria bacterium]|nr:dihydrofolate reductase [Candidatus Vogelbacteria bacterium]